MMYMLATGILVVGFSYAAVPLYRLFCQNTGFGGATKRDDDKEKVNALWCITLPVLRPFGRAKDLPELYRVL